MNPGQLLNLDGSVTQALTWPVSTQDILVYALTTAKPGCHEANYDHDNDQFRVQTKLLA